MSNDLYVDLILQSLPKSFDQFIMNFNMGKNEVMINELVNMLVATESTIKKDKPMILVSTSKAHKGTQKGKKKKSFSSKGKQPAVQGGGIKKKKGVDPNVKCFYCGELGHWKRNCKANLASLKNSMFVVETHLSLDTSSWVFDTGCGSHLCNTL